MQSFRAPARIPLFLRVVGKNSDDSPQVVSLKQTLDFCDELRIGYSESDQYQNVHPLALKAVSLYRKKTATKVPVSITLDQRVPSHVGLGIRSSHAATVLWALNQLSKKPVDDETLQEWGKDLNSEVPFFFSLGTAKCSGDVIHSIAPLTKQQIWIISPQGDLPVNEVFKRLSLSDLQDRKVEEILDQFICGQTPFFNDFEEAAFALNPKLALLKHKIREGGLRTVVMAGSGPSLFCLNGPSQKLPDGQSLVTHYLNRKKGNWY